MGLVYDKIPCSRAGTNTTITNERKLSGYGELRAANLSGQNRDQQPAGVLPNRQFPNGHH